MTKKHISVLLFLATHFISFSQSIEKTMRRLPDTGETTSYTSTLGEDSDFTVNAPYFTINGNGTVTDTVTGLMWQQTDGGEMTIEDAIIYCSNLNLGAYTDWRLPNAIEAFSILNHQYANPALNPSVFTTTTAEYWWTSDREVNDSSKVWVTNAGGGIGNHPKTETVSAGGVKKFHVRAVRDVQTPSVIPNHFTDNANGTTTDNITYLIWQSTPYSASLSWEDALAYADTLTISGITDWRLPNIKELQSINNPDLSNPSLSTAYFGITTTGTYWSSTTLPNNTTSAWYMNTEFGVTTHDLKTATHQVICVSGTQATVSLNNSNAPEIKICPNPFSSKIKIEDATGNEYFILTNSSGTILFSGSSVEDKDLSHLEGGIYFLVISGISGYHVFKLQKQ